MEHLPKRLYILSHKINLNKRSESKGLKSYKVCSLTIKLEIKNKNTSGKYSNIWKLNNTHLNNPWVKEVMEKEIRKYFELNEN